MGTALMRQFQTRANSAFQSAKPTSAFASQKGPDVGAVGGQVNSVPILTYRATTKSPSSPETVSHHLLTWRIVTYPRRTSAHAQGIGEEIAQSVKQIFSAAKVPIVWEEVDVTPILKDGKTVIPDKAIKSIKANTVALKGPLATPST